MASAINVKSAIEVNEITEQFILKLIKLSENPHQVFVGIHNAFVHGEILHEVGQTDLGENDCLLTEFFEGIDKASGALIKIQGLNE